MQKNRKLGYEFFHRDCLLVAPDLVGKVLASKTDSGIVRLRICETEAYRGQEDTACHAHRGRTKRTQTLYEKAGTIYIYLCYGMHWLLNIVTGEEQMPQAVLIRACEQAYGPGKLTKALGITGKLNAMHIDAQEMFWIEEDGFRCDIECDKRVGIGYASQEDRDKLWRFKMK